MSIYLVFAVVVAVIHLAVIAIRHGMDALDADQTETAGDCE
jgi:hypothetical protein